MFVRLLFFLWHIILKTASGVICCLYQDIDANSTSMFVSFCLGFVANRVKGVLESCVQCLSFNTIFCICIQERVRSESDCNPGGAGSKPGPATFLWRFIMK